MDGPTINELRSVVLINIAFVGIYGTMYIYSQKRLWLAIALFFGFMAGINFTGLVKRMGEDGKNIFKEQHLQTYKRDSGHNRP